MWAKIFDGLAAPANSKMKNFIPYDEQSKIDESEETARTSSSYREPSFANEPIGKATAEATLN